MSTKHFSQYITTYNTIENQHDVFKYVWLWKKPYLSLGKSVIPTLYPLHAFMQYTERVMVWTPWYVFFFNYPFRSLSLLVFAKVKNSWVLNLDVQKKPGKKMDPTKMSEGVVTFDCFEITLYLPCVPYKIQNVENFENNLNVHWIKLGS